MEKGGACHTPGQGDERLHIAASAPRDDHHPRGSVRHHGLLHRRPAGRHLARVDCHLNLHRKCKWKRLVNFQQKWHQSARRCAALDVDASILGRTNSPKGTKKIQKLQTRVHALLGRKNPKKCGLEFWNTRISIYWPNI